MTDIAKSSLQMAMNDRDMAKVSGAQEEAAKAAKQVRKFEDRIEMSKLTEKQDDELLGLAQDRATAAKNNMPTTDAAQTALSQVRAQDMSLVKRLSMYEAQIVNMVAQKKHGP